MNGSFLLLSKEQRHTILLLEALGLIHNLGKLSDKFLKSQDPEPTVEYAHYLLVDPCLIDIYNHYKLIENNKASEMVKNWLEEAGNKELAAQERSDLISILLEIQLCDWEGTTYNLAELIPFVAKPGSTSIPPSEWEKVLGKKMLPGLLIAFFHGVAHIERRGDPDTENKQKYTAVFRSTPFGREEQIQTGVVEELTTALKKLPLKNIKAITNHRQSWLTEMKKGMSKGLADTRRPHNEVSLWDWGFSTATLVKAAAVWIFKYGWPKDLEKIAFRILRINLNRLERYSRCDKISDLLGVRRILDDAYQKVKTLLEETYALANCFYHDETGAYYLLPDLEYSDEDIAVLRRKIQAQFPPDLLPRVHLDKVSITAGELDKDPAAVKKLVAEPREQSLRETEISSDNNLYLFETEWENGRPENAERCNVCGVFPIGYPYQEVEAEGEHKLSPWATQDKAIERHVCRICLDRRGRRAENWVKKGLQGTIWIDEVADDNGRLALLVGKLGLEGWLDGTLLSTIRVSSNVTKNPSPARLYRIAETGRSFWRDVINNLTQDIVGQRPFRLAIFPAPNNLLELSNFHVYELQVDGLTLSVVWDKTKGCFLTVENLNYLARRWYLFENEIADKLKGRILDVLVPTEFLRSGHVLTKVLIERVEKLSGYTPAISLLEEPSACMTLVPAAKAMELARAVKRKYEDKMGRVRDRLPLYLGLVFCHCHTPFRALLEAGRSMLNMANDRWEGWRLMDKIKNSEDEYKLIFDNGITWRIPIVAGDKQTEDKWYPRMYQGDSNENKKIKHLDELKVRNPSIPPDKGWKVWVKPSRFDFEYLDTSGRRFEIYYDQEGRRPRRTRPLYLEDMERFENLWKYFSRLTVSQRYQVISIIESTRERWYGFDVDVSSKDTVFKQFVADTLAQAAWPKHFPWTAIQPEWKEKLIQAGVKGELADLAELYMAILKN